MNERSRAYADRLVKALSARARALQYNSLYLDSERVGGHFVFNVAEIV